MVQGNTEFLNKHEAIVSRLEYWQVKDGKMHYYPKDKFGAGLPTFNNLPIIYAQKHPSEGVKGRNIDAVLKGINGSIAGYTSGALINNAGSENLRTTFNITDPEIDRKINNGEMSISLGFRYNAPDVGYLDGINGDHVLIYDKALGIPQGDPGALILNQGSPEQDKIVYVDCELGSGNIMAEQDYNKGMGEVISLLKANMGEFNDKFLAQEAEKLKLATELDSVKADNIKLNTAIGEKDTLIAELQVKVQAIETAAIANKAQRIKNNQENFWNGLPNAIKDQFKERKADMEDPELMFKLNQDINAALLVMPKVKLMQAEGAEEVAPELKGNQDAPVEDNAWDKYSVRF